MAAKVRWLPNSDKKSLLFDKNRLFSRHPIVAICCHLFYSHPTFTVMSAKEAIFHFCNLEC